MEKDNVIPINRKRCTRLEEEKYIEGAINCLAQVRLISRDPRNNALMLPYLITSIRGIFRCLKHTSIALEDIGISEKQLIDFISPPELGLPQEEVEKRWNWVLK